jgi:hypothetical protein
MFIKLRRILPEGKETDVTINLDQIVWAQPDLSGDTITILAVSGPELLVKRDEVASNLLSGAISEKSGG